MIQLRSFLVTCLLLLGRSLADYTLTLYQNPVGSSGTTNLALLNPSLPTIFIIHGWLHGSTAPWVSVMRDAYLSTSSANVVVFDWSTDSLSLNYYAAAKGVGPAGKYLGLTITTLFTNQKINITITHLVGFSLGAHVGGVAGETFKAATNLMLEVIVGLDAPGLAFSNDDGRLSNTDAKFVQAFHTSAFGKREPYAHVDVFFNTNGVFWGLFQPNCPLNPGVPMKPIYQNIFCDHIRSVVYWIESIVNNQFLAILCDSWGQSSGGTRIGYGLSTAVRGRFCLKTNGVTPFGKGPNGIV